MPTPRKPTAPTTAAIDQFCAHFDDLFARFEERTALREYLIGLLLPREHNKTLVELAAIVPGARRQALHHFLHDAPWDAAALNRRRLAQWQAHPVLGPHAGGVLIVDETGDPKRGSRIVLAAQQYRGKLGHVANGVVAVTSHWTDGSRHVPLGVRPYRPASRLPKGRTDPAFYTKPQLAWDLIQEAQAAGIPFRLVVADSVYGESADLEAKLFAAHIPYVMGLRPSHGTWQQVDDPAHPPAFTPAEAAQRRPVEAWQRTVRFDSHGTQLVRYVAELALGPSYGPDKGVRLIAATLDPTQLKPESTWYLATSFPLAQVSAEQVYELYRLRDWIEHFYKPVKHELGWADYQTRCALSRRLCATGSWSCWPTPSACWWAPCRPRLPRQPLLPLLPLPPPPLLPPRLTTRRRVGEKSAPAVSPRVVWAATLRQVRSWLCPWAQLQRYWTRWSSSAPPPELAALLAHVARSLPLEAPAAPT